MNLTAAFRMLVGAVGVVHAVRFFRLGYLGSKSGEEFVVPLFDLVPTSPSLQLIAMVTFLGGAAAVACGLAARWGACAAAVAIAYVLVSDWQTFHHSSFLALNLFVVAAWLGSPDGWQRWAALWAGRSLVIAVYALSGIHKVLGPGFRDGLVVEQLMGTTDLGARVLELAPWSVPLASWATIGLELGLPVALLLPAVRGWAAAAGVGFHLGMLLLTGRGSVFHLYLPAAYLLFFVRPSDELPTEPGARAGPVDEAAPRPAGGARPVGDRGGGGSPAVRDRAGT